MRSTLTKQTLTSTAVAAAAFKGTSYLILELSMYYWTCTTCAEISKQSTHAPILRFCFENGSIYRQMNHKRLDTTYRFGKQLA